MHACQDFTSPNLILTDSHGKVCLYCFGKGGALEVEDCAGGTAQKDLRHASMLTSSVLSMSSQMVSCRRMCTPAAQVACTVPE